MTNTNTQHTPGPWRAETTHTYPQVVRDAEDNVVTFGCGDRSNARLIAAAPDLLAALREVERHMVANGYSPLGRLADVRGAIAKATT